MTETLYIDVLVVVNTFVNYFLLLATSLFIGQKTKRYRLILGALLGGISSIVILADQIPAPLMILIKIIICCTIILISFGYISSLLYIKHTITFLSVSLVFGGIMLVVWLFIKPSGMYLKNGVVYFDISAIFLVGCTIISYLIIVLCDRLFSKKIHKKEIYAVVVSLFEKKVTLNALVDNGNTLRDSFSGKRVVIAELEAVSHLLPLELIGFFGGDSSNLDVLNHFPSLKIRPIPYRAVGGDGMLYAFCPDKISVVLKDNKMLDQDAVVGVTNQNLSGQTYNALLYKF